jgi:hypothetical protein
MTSHRLALPVEHNVTVLSVESKQNSNGTFTEYEGANVYLIFCDNQPDGMISQLEGIATK